MKIFSGDSYEDYVNAQISANKRKINHSWVEREDIVKISKFCKDPKHILCHGTRQGYEQKYFLEIYKECNVIGTEISPTALQFENTVQHDFHDVKKEWISKFDIVYSNSFDHTYDPNKCISIWSEQLKSDGILAIDASQRENINNCDRLFITKDELAELCKTYNIKEVHSYKTNQLSFMFIGEKSL